MFFIFWHKGIYESLLRRVTAVRRTKDLNAAYEFFMKKLIVFVYGIWVCYATQLFRYLTVIIHYKSLS